MTTVGGKFIDVDEMITHPVLDSSYVNIADFVKGDFEEGQITPLEMANKMEYESKKAREIAKEFRDGHPNKQEFVIELNDIDAWGHFGMYVADKVKGGIALQRYRTTMDKAHQIEAIKHLEKALLHWKDFTAAMETYNVAQMPYQFDQEFSWRKHIISAEKDIEIAKK